MEYKEISLGIDQSYKNTGISIFADDKKKLITSVHMENVKTNTEKRQMIRTAVEDALKVCLSKGGEVVCLIEKIRLQSNGEEGKKKAFISIDYIKSIGALNAVIIDICSFYGVSVYSVDTRCWKSTVIGTSKPKANVYGVDPKKYPTIEWVKNNGWINDILIPLPDNTRKKKGVFIMNEKKFIFNDDAADSAGISSFYFKNRKNMLTLET